MINLSKIADTRGNLTVVELGNGLPFAPGRVYWTYDIPAGGRRGGHAHKHCRELVVAVSGSFTVTTDDGHNRQTHFLNHPYRGLLIDRAVWRTLEDFSSGAVCLVVAEDPYDPDDYIYDYQDFITYVRGL